MIVLTVPVPPSANRWHRKYRNRTVLSDEARTYTDALTVLVMQQLSLTKPRIVPPAFRTEPLKVDIQWFRERRSGDVDKRGAILLDALQGLAYTDDAQIVDYRICRHDFEPKAARMVVTIQPVGD